MGERAGLDVPDALRAARRVMGLRRCRARQFAVGGWLMVLLLALSLGGCGSRGPAPVDSWDWRGPVPEGYYLIRKGDTLSEIAQRNRVSTGKLVRWNKLKAPYTVYAGKLLRIAPPDGGRVASGRTDRKPERAARESGASRASARAPTPVRPGSGAAASGIAWAWPLPGPVSQGFRAGDRTRQGLRIGCRAGEPVRAAGDGRVVYSGSGLKGYGNLIIVKHNASYLSAYGFNRRLLVEEGDSVRRGQTVAECGQGAEGAYLLHFEVRRDGVAVDPILYLPPRT
jgi:lipoprotein NlpD